MKGTLMAKKKQLPEEVAHSEAYVKDFFDMAVPSAIRFNVDHFICGGSYRSRIQGKTVRQCGRKIIAFPITAKTNKIKANKLLISCR